MARGNGKSSGREAPRGGLEEALVSAIERHAHRAGAIMMQHQSDEHFEASVTLVSMLAARGFEGVYISLKQPFREAQDALRKRGMKDGKVLFVDASGDSGSDGECMHIARDLEVEDLTGAISRSLLRLKAAKRFIFLDSLVAIANRRPLSDTLRFCAFLALTLKKHDAQDMLLILNTPKGFWQERFLSGTALHFDEVVDLADLQKPPARRTATPPGPPGEPAGPPMPMAKR